MVSRCLSSRTPSSTDTALMRCRAITRQRFHPSARTSSCLALFFWCSSHSADWLLQLSAGLASNTSSSGLLSKVDWLITEFNDCFLLNLALKFFCELVHSAQICSPLQLVTARDTSGCLSKVSAFFRLRVGR